MPSPFIIIVFPEIPLNMTKKQPLKMFYKRRCSLRFHKVHRKTPVPDSLFNKVEGPRPATLLKKRI